MEIRKESMIVFTASIYVHVLKIIKCSLSMYSPQEKMQIINYSKNREINVQGTIPVFVFEVLLLLPAVVLFKHADVVETKR